MAENHNSQENNAIENINSHLTEAGQKVASNKKAIYWGVGIIAVVAVFVGSYFWIYRNPGLNKSWAAYNQVELTANGNDTVRAKEFAKVADKYGRFDAGNVAALAAGEAYYNIGKYEEAAKYVSKFSTSDPVMKAQSTLLLGDCYVNLKKYDDAVSAYNKAIREAEGNPQIVPVALFKQANVYDAQKNYQKALDCFKQIKSEFPEFQFGNGLQVDALIAREEARLGK